ncbi:acyl-CoA dehydrogenase family protein [Xanthobacter dioxanivorans]|uniref:Medium-chain specific acyl-CoA dehydrogenase, mitochondrial n=1 Tax=Xanthobacter dioxanivorans TaxID=2528964 RepID=A0A974PPA0_9HYPH|nr:acyl-CoA dehydrogenase family protein [Xanthobacter dioxanivorans]QRG07262.1 acyl-CoA dehydrogenase family protein [Xanthobacter dioxanivorans]
MDFALPQELAALEARTSAFVREEILPFETDPRRTAHGPTDDLRRELVAKARAAGLLSPHVAREWGGLGLSHLGKAVVFEAAGYSMLGPVALNIAAPDEGNMHLLAEVASPAQNARFLAPMAVGETRSCFLMTEPHPGAGADPSLMKTTAVREGDHFVVNGVKWLITGAEGAAFAIVMARTVVDGRDVGATMFLTDLPAAGFRIARALDTLDSSFTGGHAEVALENLRVPASDVLGAVGEGFRYAQARLVPARLTHCMRWLGAARRAHDIATDYASRREAFGGTLLSHEGLGFMLADNEIDLHTTRLAIRHAAWLLDQGQKANVESSMVKVFASEAIFRIVDRSLQVLGGLGMTRDTEVERIFRDVRGFRIYDGPSEVHRWNIARRLARGAAVKAMPEGRAA